MNGHFNQRLSFVKITIKENSLLRNILLLLRKNTKDSVLGKTKYTTLTPRGIKSKSISLRYQSVHAQIKFRE